MTFTTRQSARQPASQRASHYVSHSAGIHMQVYKCVCVRVCICASVYCIVYSGKRRKYYYAHKHSRTHARATHDIASEESQAGRCTRAGNTTTSDALNRTWRIEICRGSTKLPELKPSELPSSRAQMKPKPKSKLERALETGANAVIH